uniref:Release factor glutamine methyltransferase n=1 Tax=Chlorobium chlorochromatii (strain CaD3) TaxID=340177 RepID=Q3AQP2_CHLCH
MENQKEWQVIELLKTTTDFFAAKEMSEPRISAERLLGHVLQKSRLELYLHHDAPISPSELEQFRSFCRQRLQGRPVQYITGEQYFYGAPFFVDERVLIPRPETELLVERALEVSGVSALAGEVAVLDVGTGSGCIAVTLATLAPNLRIVAVDLSPAALDVARLNAERHGVTNRMTFVQADMTSPYFAQQLPFATYQLIISNPPYIPKAEWATLEREVRDFEPELALTTPSGMECYQALISAAPTLLADGGTLALELHADGARAVATMLESAGLQEVALMKDYGGFERIITARKSEKS